MNIEWVEVSFGYVFLTDGVCCHLTEPTLHRTNWWITLSVSTKNDEYCYVETLREAKALAENWIKKELSKIGRLAAK